MLAGGSGGGYGAEKVEKRWAFCNILLLRSTLYSLVKNSQNKMKKENPPN
jgi:hypothetical protein